MTRRPVVHVSTTAPEPPKADFAIFIDFDKDSPRPQRVFQAAEGLISAFERLDKTLVHSLDPSIETVLLLEDIEAGSLKIWLRDRLSNTENQSLYELDWRPLVGRYLVAAKYAYVEWINDEEERGRPGSLSDLRKRFLELARKTDLHRIPAYGVPSAAELIASTDDMKRALSKLDKNDKAAFVSEDGTAEFDLSIDWEGLEVADLAVRETIDAPPSPMILGVKRPDYLGEAQWEFRHGRRTIRAKIEDTEWLTAFQTRGVDVRPGDALRCIVKQQIKYGYDNELVAEVFTVIKVKEVLENRYRQIDMFNEDD